MLYVVRIIEGSYVSFQRGRNHATIRVVSPLRPDMVFFTDAKLRFGEVLRQRIDNKYKNKRLYSINRQKYFKKSVNAVYF